MEKREFHVDNEYRYTRTGPGRWIVSHMMRHPLFPIVVVVTSIINNYAYGNIQLYVGHGFDVITKAGWLAADLLVVVAFIAGSAITQGLTGVGRNIAVEFLAQRLERESREELYGSLLGKSQTFHGRQRVGDIMARATNDMHMLNLMFSPGLMLIVDSMLAMVVPFFMILTINPALGLVPAIFLVLLSLTLWDYNKRLTPVSIGQREQFGLLNSSLAETISGIEVVKSNVQERYEWNKFTGNARSFRDYFVKQGIVEARYWPMMAFAVCWGAALFHSLLLWKQGTISLGQVIAFMGLFGTFRFSTFISLFSFNLVQIGIASAGRILEFINYKSEMDQNSAGRGAHIDGRVEFRNVSFAFDENPVLTNVSFTAEPGQTVAIVGQTGSGKTTLTRLINRIFDVQKGSVLIDGVDVREWSMESLRSQISFIEQDVFLFSLSIRENIAFGVQDAGLARIETAAREAQADAFIRSFKDGYETEIGERGVTLSGGQKQRIAIARAFLTDPRILILDDSTSAIDSRTEDEIQQAMRRIAQKRTTFIITHRLSQIRWADHILVLRGGEVVDQGSHDDLLARSGDYQRIFALL
ncbi:MAG TPA: ABC transporter ATP-binding protein [Spirochaetia bacterium]|nr:ABC transporter ATP-binding protein [Spirochaetia bacterium]